MDRLTPLSAAFLEAEDVDPSASLAIGSLAVFEGPAPDFEELVEAVRGRLPLIPRYRQRVRSVPLDLGAPVWVDDPDFELRDHVTRVRVPEPAGPSEVGTLVSDLMTFRMDRAHPLWEIWLFEGLPDKRWGLLLKVHHALADGVSGTDLYRLIFDATPTPAPGLPDTWEPRPAPSSLALTALAVRDLALTPVRLGGSAARSVRRPRALAQSAADSLRGLLALSGAIRPADQTSLTGDLHGGRRYAWAQVSMKDVRLVRERLGGTVNDVALAVVTGGFRALLLSRGETPAAHSLRSLVPVSTRAPGTEADLGNQVSLLLPYLPVEVADPVARLDAVTERLRDLRQHHEVEGGEAVTSAAGLSPFFPVAWGGRFALALPQPWVSTVTTNVPGPRQSLYCLGRRATGLLPYVPIADRVRVGVAILSYIDDLTFGITGDLDSTGDLEVLTEGISRAMEELTRVATR
jgi:diacylglycerol O-acyltransferase